MKLYVHLFGTGVKESTLYTDLSTAYLGITLCTKWITFSNCPRKHPQSSGKAVYTL